MEDKATMAVLDAVQHYEDRMRTIMFPTETPNQFLELSAHYEEEARQMLLERSSKSEEDKRPQKEFQDMICWKRGEFWLINEKRSQERYKELIKRHSDDSEEAMVKEASAGPGAPINVSSEELKKARASKGKGRLLEFITKPFQTREKKGNAPSQRETKEEGTRIQPAFGDEVLYGGGMSFSWSSLKRLVLDSLRGPEDHIHEKGSSQNRMTSWGKATESLTRQSYCFSAGSGSRLNFESIPERSKLQNRSGNGTGTEQPPPAIEEPASAGVTNLLPPEPTQCAAVSVRGLKPRLWGCQLCEEFQDSGEVVDPVCQENTYRLDLKSSGLFRCLKTGIQFHVKCAMSITYNVESWESWVKDLPESDYEALGPLFNIEAEAHMVSAVYLPHNLCQTSFSEDIEQIKCAHFKDGNMTLESPSWVDAFHIVLEDPDFSCLGPLLTRRKKKVPIHGMVLVYFRAFSIEIPEDKEYKIHLYLLPQCMQEEQVLDQRKIKFGYQRVEKPETTEILYIKNTYLIKGPLEAYVTPKALKFQSQWPSNRHPFTEIGVKGEIRDTDLNVLEEMSHDIVWNTLLTKGELNELIGIRQGHPGSSQQPFVDLHRQALIQQMSNIEPVLDQLLERTLLTPEQYDNICAKTTDQEKVRELYRFIRSWSDGDKEELYQILKHQKPRLIRNLEREDLASRRC